jgi:RNA polymerase sigma factor (sigma-70 family)
VGEKVAITAQKCDLSENVRLAAEIFLEHGGFIRSVICHKVGNESQAEDLFQDFFLSLAAKPVPQDVRNIRSFIYKALTNDIADRARKIERYQKMTHKYADFHSLPINNKTAEDALLEKEQVGKMIEVIGKQVSKSEANAISLRYNENLCIGEVADKMHIDKRSVSRYISTGLQKIRQFLAYEKEV